MERAGNIPPHTISSVVLERNNELKFGGKRNPDSEINRILESDKKKNNENKLQETVDALSKQVEKLSKESSEKDNLINQSQTAIQDLLTMVQDLKNGANNQEEIKVKKTSKPKKDN
jgi:peptidoglycan hydrolase CwlO-like protein